MIVEIRGGFIGFELVKESSETLNIFCDRGGLADVEHLTEQRITLITPKMIMKKLTKVGPRETVGLIEGFDPARSRPLEMHARHLDP